MKITGVAPKIAVPTFIYLLITIIISKIYPHNFKISNDSYFTILLIGLLLILAGIIVVIMVAKKLKRFFYSNSLMTDGLYKIVRNPMYAAYLLFIIPGISLIFNSILALTTVLINFILLRIFIKEEYKFLEEKFPEEYKNYLDKVLIKFL